MTRARPVDRWGQTTRVWARVRFGVTPLCDCVDSAPETFPRPTCTNEVLFTIHSTYYCY